MKRIRTVQAKVTLPFHPMSESFTSYGLRAGGPVTLDPFLNLDDFTMSEPTFPPHPHAGFSAVTYMFEDSGGAFVNRDSLGDRSRIEPGGFHWTQAGRGMVHEEVPERPGTSCHGLQMFVNLREVDKDAPPRAFHLAASEVPEVRANGVRVRVLAGAFGDVVSPLDELATRLNFFDVHLDRGAELVIDAGASDTAFGLVVGGAGRAGTEGGGTVVEAHTAVGFQADGDAIRFAGGDGGLHLVVGVGTPLGEPIVFGGPFVMTRAEALRDAERRFRQGEMGTLDPSPSFARPRGQAGS